MLLKKLVNEKPENFSLDVQVFSLHPGSPFIHDFCKPLLKPSFVKQLQGNYSSLLSAIREINLPVVAAPSGVTRSTSMQTGLSSSHIVNSILDIEDFASLDTISNHSESTHVSGSEETCVSYGLVTGLSRSKSRA
jgi:hypothetical protein